MLNLTNEEVCAKFEGLKDLRGHLHNHSQWCMTTGVILSPPQGTRVVVLAEPEGPQTPHSLRERDESYTAQEQISANPEDFFFFGPE